MQQGGWNPQGGGAPPPGQPGGYGQPQQGYGPPPGGGYGAPQGGGYAQPMGPPPGMPPGYQAPTGAAATGMDKGFFAALFDFSFSSFVTTKVLKVLYGIWILGAVGVLLGGFASAVFQMTSSFGSVIGGLLTLILSPVAAFFTLLMGRMYFELIIVAFKVAENLESINRKTKE